MNNTGILFNLWGFTPNYKSASDGIMLDMLLESMEEKQNALQSRITTADGNVRTGIFTEKAKSCPELLCTEPTTE